MTSLLRARPATEIIKFLGQQVAGTEHERHRRLYGGPLADALESSMSDDPAELAVDGLQLWSGFD